MEDKNDATLFRNRKIGHPSSRRHTFSRS